MLLLILPLLLGLLLPATTLVGHASVLNSEAEGEWYGNSLLLGVFPDAPIRSLTVHLVARPWYGDSDAFCGYFGPGSDAVGWAGEKTFLYTDASGGPLDRSQAVMVCAFGTHAPAAPLSPSDFYLENLRAEDAEGNEVPVRLCVLDYDMYGLDDPGDGDCRYGCGDAVCHGGEPTAVDALAILKSAVGSGGPYCNTAMCDPSGDGGVSAVDAMITLQSAVGVPRALLCQPPYGSCYEF